MTSEGELDFIIVCLSSVLSIKAENLLKGRLLPNVALHSLDLHLGNAYPVTGYMTLSLCKTKVI